MSNINLLHLKENKLQPIKTKFNVFYDDTIIQIKQKNIIILMSQTLYLLVIIYLIRISIILLLILTK